MKRSFLFVFALAFCLPVLSSDAKKPVKTETCWTKVRRGTSACGSCLSRFVRILAETAHEMSHGVHGHVTDDEGE